MSPTVQGCQSPTVAGCQGHPITIEGGGYRLAQMIGQELFKQAKRWVLAEERLIEQLSREVERVRRTAPRTRYIHEVLDASQQVINNEDELPAAELLKALRRIAP